MTQVKLKTSMLRYWTKAYLWERVPLYFEDPETEAKAVAVAAEFAETRWALAQGPEVDADELCEEAIKFARSKGYELLEEPPCEYTPAPSPADIVKCWGPP